MQKRSVLIFVILGLLAFSLFASLVPLVFAADPTPTPDPTNFNAAGASAAQAITKAIDFIKQVGNPIFTAILGPTGETGGDLFSKILTFFLAMLVILAILELVPFFKGKSGISILVSLVISVLGIRFVPINLINSLTYPSSALVSIIVLGLPFIIMFTILAQFQSQFLRRAAWTVYATIIVVLWFYNYDNGWSWIYLLFIFACIAAFWFDGTLKRFLEKNKGERAISYASVIQIQRIEAEIRDLQGALAIAQNSVEKVRIKDEIRQKKDSMKLLSSEV